MPVIIGAVILALVIVAFSISRSMRSSTGLPTPAKPRMQDEAMRHMREKALQGRMRRPGGPMTMPGQQPVAPP